MDLFYVDISIYSPENIIDLVKFYNSIYIKSFPDENERESLENFLYYLYKFEKEQKLKKEDIDYSFHIQIVKNENREIIAGIIYDYFIDINAAVIEYIVVDKKYQSQGVGYQVFSDILDRLNKNSMELLGKSLSYIFCEVDFPEYNQDENKKYLYFWDKVGLKGIDFKYIQPVLSEDKENVKNLLLSVCISDKQGDISFSVILKRFIFEYMHFSMNIKNPLLNMDYIQMCEEIDSKSEIKFSSLLDLLNEKEFL